MTMPQAAGNKNPIGLLHLKVAKSCGDYFKFYSKEGVLVISFKRFHKMMQIRVVVLRESSFQMEHKAFFRRLRKGNLRLNYKVLKRSRNTMLGCLSR